ncbi:MAG: DUF2442 domain-containing protein [Chloroflexota bacterium]|nr:DUF2442 domain-containing protein [Chloroflexota bacterium]
MNAIGSVWVLTNGQEVERDLDGLLRGPVFEQIRSSDDLFRAVRAEGGTLVWPNEADLDPDVVIWGGRAPMDASHPPKTLVLRVPQ